MEGWWVWGSSVVKGEDGRYHMFASRVPKYQRFHPAWMIASEIVRASSDTPEGPYAFEEVVLPARGAQYWDGRSTHNPRMVKHGDTYVLYYMGSTHPFEDVTEEMADQLTLDSKWCIAGRANKRIGIAVANSVFGPWERMDAPVLETKPDSFYSFLTSNPAPVIHDDGSAHLIFKSRRYEGHIHSEMNIGLATAPHYAGPYTVLNDEPLFSEKTFGVIEDPFLWKNEDGFHMLAKDQFGEITGERGAGILAHSPDCLGWTLHDDPKAYTRNIQWADGSRQLLGNVERCSALVEDGQPSHLFFAIWEGEGGFSDPKPGNHSWNMVVPLKPVSAGSV
ncbi:hypothetical protein PDESU_02728 [Pontiella desulfatans]|uniref:Glycosyl hydrolase family 43 n=2 Tax=Pontiella desulfatans TaxID=2750659 RepID=A0A6C2U2Y8_PONDE|nr:hypothetical protein PDESU_02728 [Pontiella desulfatans]